MKQLSNSKTTQALIGREIKRHRNLLGLNQTQLAASSGVSNTYITKIERGTINPSITVIVGLCRALGITVDNLLEGTDALNPSALLDSDLYAILLSTQGRKVSKKTKGIIKYILDNE